MPVTTFELVILKHRLSLEMKVKEFARSRSGLLTMRRIRQIFPAVKNRAQAAAAVEEALVKSGYSV